MPLKYSLLDKTFLPPFPLTTYFRSGFATESDPHSLFCDKLSGWQNFEGAQSRSPLGWAEENRRSQLSFLSKSLSSTSNYFRQSVQTIQELVLGLNLKMTPVGDF
jgi:hypothetical protein